ncbi:MAG: tRNA uridine-5-carboxymethylaminomethyl(34) synthesis GTPase MnmE [Deltaproteobacteria bacterium]|nr:tRNA uridine-5-carboxymethylaminomethyl(34) synthesis GTPase MnmE [Deltaproteobacteria bacterium]
MIPETIAALSTPAGSGGIAILRLSGPRAHAIVEQVFRPWPLRPDFFHLYLGYFYDPVSNLNLDQVLVTLMPPGRSYTGEAMAEIHCHGGAYNSKKILTLLFSLGAQTAAPGEFTKRAYLSGRLDLTQAEAVASLIAAESEAELAAATAQLAGGLSDCISRMLISINQLLAAVEVEIDLLAEEGLNYSRENLTDPLVKLERQCRELLDSYQRGRILQTGIKVVLAGRPNVGKSSLLNALLAEDRVLVSSISGTTRDIVSAPLEIAGIKVELSDTAGLDKPQAELEALGMARTERWLEQAGLILLVFDQSRALNDFDDELYAKIKAKSHLLLLNKDDLEPVITAAQLQERFSYQGPVLRCVGARERVDISEVIAGITSFIKSRTTVFPDSVMICQQRHFDLLSKVSEALGRALALAYETVPLIDMLAEELHQIRFHLLKITGREHDASEGLLDIIFSQFCVGK